MRLIQALKWSFGSELVSKAIQPVVFLVLARLLAPADFGVISAAMMVTALAQILCDAGMGQALVQRRTQVTQAANAAFWINLMLGAAVAVVLFFSAEVIARTVFQDVRVQAVLQVSTIQILLVAVSSVHTALLQKEMAFRKLFWVRFATVTLPGVASIPLALYGFGYWALVAGGLAGQLAQSLLLWYMSPWRPTMRVDPGMAREIARFGVWAAASGLLAWFYVWADALIVGMYLGSHELGVYRVGNQLSTMVFALLLEPVLPVLYSHLSRMADPRKISQSMQVTIRFLIVIGIPIGLTMLVVAPEIEFLLFGDRWKGIALVIGTLGLMHGIAWTVGMNGEAYRALGHPRVETLVMLASAPLYVAIYLAFVGDGLASFVYACFCAMLVGLAVQLAVLRHVLRIPLSGLAGFVAKIAFTASAALWIGEWAFRALAMSPWLAGLKIATVAALCAAAILFVERKGTVLQIRSFLK